MTKYAENTSVPVERSRAEIENILMRYGANKFVFGWTETGSTIGFEVHNRFIKFVLPLPDKNAKEYLFTPERGIRRSKQEAIKYWEQACRQRWRDLALAIKAKLEAAQCGITTFEDEFMAHVVLPGGRALGEMVRPEIVKAYESGKVPKLLSGY